MFKSKNIWGLALIVLSFASILGGTIIRECLIAGFGFDNGSSIILFLVLLLWGFFLFVSGLSGWKARLLVIAVSIIITLFLIGIILTSLSTARQKARGTGVMALMSSMRATAESKYVYDEKTKKVHYPSDTCDQEVGSMSNLFKAIINQGANGTTCLTDSDFQSWAVSSELPFSNVSMRTSKLCEKPLFISKVKGSGEFYCVDSTSFSGKVSGQITGPNCDTAIKL